MKDVYFNLIVLALFLKGVMSANIGEMCPHVQFSIGSFLVNPLGSLGSLNKHSRNTFTKVYPLKGLVDEVFDIPELSDLKPHEPELQVILLREWCRDKPIYFMRSIAEDILSEKKPFQVLHRPLTSYVCRIYQRLSYEEKEKYFNATFEYNFSKICLAKGYYDLIFDLLKDNPIHLFSWYSKLLRNKNIFEALKANPTMISNLKASLSHFQPNNRVLNALIADAIILYEVPEEIFAEYLTHISNQFQNLIDILIKSPNSLPESEYPRIHAKLRYFVSKYYWSQVDQTDQKNIYLYSYFNILNDIRFGQEEPNLDLSNWEHDKFQEIGEVAFLGKRKNLVLKIFNSPRFRFDFKILDYLIGILLNSCYNAQLLANRFNYVLEILESSPEKVRNFAYKGYSLPQVVLNNYAIKNIRSEYNRLVFDFVATEGALALGMPSTLQIERENKDSCLFDFGILWSQMRVKDEETFASFLADYRKLSMNLKNITVRAEVIELISTSANLKEMIQNIGIKFNFEKNLNEFLKVMNMPNIIGLAQIFDFTDHHFHLPHFTNRLQLNNFEKITGISIADHVLYLEQNYKFEFNGYKMKENDYFKFRLVFAYWIRSNQKQRILEIESSKIIELLDLEFRDEMKELRRFK